MLVDSRGRVWSAWIIVILALVLLLCIAVELDQEASAQSDVILVTPLSLTVDEPDGQGTFTVSLTSQPTAVVTVGLEIDSGECAVTTDTLVLDAVNWQTGVTVTVTAQDDDVVDGEQECTVVTTAAVSADATYHDEDPADVVVTVTDDDVAGFTVSPVELTVVEPDGHGTFTMSLTSQPTDAVTIELEVGSGECTVSPDALLLDTVNWQTGVTVTVTAQDDDVVDGEQVCTVEAGRARSSDSNYNRLNPQDVAVTVTDDDVAGFTVSPLELTVAEPDGQGTFTVSLTSQPTAVVTVGLEIDSDECAVTTDTLVLDAVNWQTGVTVTVTAQDDDVVDGEQECTVVTTAAVSADATYHDEDPADVVVTVTDDDVAGIKVSPTILAVSEPDGADVFIVALRSQPVAQVALSLSVSNSECTVSPVSIVLDTANWSEGAIVSVTAVDDDLNDGQQSCVVQTALTSSADPDYDGLDAEDVIVVVYDDDIIHRVCLPSIANRWSVMPDIPTLSPADNGDGDGTYSIGWSATDHAETYVLEEATDGGFFGASVIYSGPDTSYTVTGRGAARYYYRVKGRTAWSDSGWSNARTVDVLWEKEPNDQALDQANGPIISTLNYYGTFPSQYDVSDYFFFDLSASHPVRIRLTHIADGLNYDLVLRDASLAIRGYSAQLSNHNEEIRTSILPAGRYYIQVFHRPGEGSTQPYHLNYALE